ncbi:hypothetical protein ACWIUD_09915 [Helicobacter sp. 23-1044]
MQDSAFLCTIRRICHHFVIARFCFAKSWQSIFRFCIFVRIAESALIFCHCEAVAKPQRSNPKKYCHIERSEISQLDSANLE